MAVYQEKAKERIKKGFRRMSNIVAKGKEEQFKEADTRKIVSDVLHEYLGWDKFENITAEQMIGSRYADYVIKKGSDQIAVIEVKQIGMKLKETHLNQARLYAIDEGIDWIVLTNGDMWQVYRMDYKKKSPETTMVFNVAISDREIKPTKKAELFYLISEEAYRKNEIEDYYQRNVALSGENLASHILGEPVLNKIRLSIRASTGQKLTNAEIANALVDRLFIASVDEDCHDRAVKKIERIEKKK